MMYLRMLLLNVLTLLLFALPDVSIGGDPPRLTPCERLGEKGHFSRSVLDVTPDHSSFLNAWVTTDKGGKPEKHEQCLSSPNGKFLFILHVNGEWAVHEAVEPYGDVTTCCDRGRSGHHFEEGRYVLQLQETGLMPVFKNSASPPAAEPKYLTCTIADEPKGFFHLDMRDDGQLILYKGKPGSQNQNDAVWTATNGSLKKDCSKVSNSGSTAKFTSCTNEICVKDKSGITFCRCLDH